MTNMYDTYLFFGSIRTEVISLNFAFIFVTNSGDTRRLARESSVASSALELSTSSGWTDATPSSWRKRRVGVNLSKSEEKHKDLMIVPSKRVSNG